jgi:SAM-dependent methyltransferase
MSTKEIKEYYDATENSDVRQELIYATTLISNDRIAIDCGCGSGSDIAFLRENDFIVHAFDIEKESIKRCKQRFINDDKVYLSKCDFSTFAYPDASLVVADASLFFCPSDQFNTVWDFISNSLLPKKGIFCGSFLGPNDTMAGASYNKEAFWPEITVFTEEKLQTIFTGYEIHKCIEHELSGKTAQGVPHHWHIFSVVAQKI